jgi:hypothetical protein
MQTLQKCHDFDQDDTMHNGNLHKDTQHGVQHNTQHRDTQQNNSILALTMTKLSIIKINTTTLRIMIRIKMTLSTIIFSITTLIKRLLDYSIIKMNIKTSSIMIHSQNNDV